MQATLVVLETFQGGVKVKVMPRQSGPEEDLTVRHDDIVNVPGRSLFDGIGVGDRLNATVVYGASGYELASIDGQQRSV